MFIYEKRLADFVHKHACCVHIVIYGLKAHSPRPLTHIKQNKARFLVPVLCMASHNESPDHQVVAFRRAVRLQLSEVRPCKMRSETQSAPVGFCSKTACLHRFAQLFTSKPSPPATAGAKLPDTRSSTEHAFQDATVHKSLVGAALADHLRTDHVQGCNLATVMPGALDELLGKHSLTFEHLIDVLRCDIHDLSTLGLTPCLLIDHWDTCGLAALNSHMLTVHRRTLYDWFRFEQAYTLEEIVFSGFFTRQALKAVGATDAILQLDGIDQNTLSSLMLALHHHGTGLDVACRTELISKGVLPKLGDIVTCSSDKAPSESSGSRWSFTTSACVARRA